MKRIDVSCPIERLALCLTSFWQQRISGFRTVDAWREASCKMQYDLIRCSEAEMSKNWRSSRLWVILSCIHSRAK
jgi:hypothetical protein